VALAAVDRLGDKLAGYHAYHATRADVLRRLGCGQKSRAAYDKAIELAGNTAETAYLTRRRNQLGSACAGARPRWNTPRGADGGVAGQAFQRRPSRFQSRISPQDGLSRPGRWLDADRTIWRSFLEP
jgi:hypothetical protein